MLGLGKGYLRVTVTVRVAEKKIWDAKSQNYPSAYMRLHDAILLMSVESRVQVNITTALTAYAGK